ncbi:MAG: ABC transporter permease [Bacteroidota bacterium]
MYRKFLQPFGLAFDNIRANLFHTFLSVLGIVIGVAALVSILSLIDGMEKFVRDQIAETTSIKALSIGTETHKMVNNLRIKKDSFQVLEYVDFNKLVAENGPIGKYILRTSMTKEISLSDKKAAAVLNCVSMSSVKDSLLAEGHTFSTEDVQNKQAVAVISKQLASVIDSTGASVLGKHFKVDGRDIAIIGVLKADKHNDEPSALIPISLLSLQELRASPPDCFLEAETVEQVPGLKTKVKDWLNRRYGAAANDFEVSTNDLRVDQTAKAFLLFRIIMGLIVGISVLVGGVGVMNVLLISVTERTPEIGLRKALGAKKADILRLFLSESITVSAFGSFLGLAFGVLGTMIIVPIVRALTDVPFQAIYTWNTFIVISVIAVLIGIIFGTYPALKAARLDPVEAIRRE